MWPLLAKLHENTFDATPRFSHGWRHPTVGENCAMGRLSVVKVATSARSPYEMMHRAWSSIEEVPYCFSKSSV